MDPGTRLMERVRARDVSAFEALYDGYHRLVFGIALRMLGDAASAEDVTQAVFLKLWSAPHAFHGGAFVAWLARITRNRTLDVLRARAARPEAQLPCGEMPLDPDTSWGRAPDDEVAARLDGARVREALASLPPEQRTLIELGFFGGITHHELALRTGTPLGTVKTRIRTGLRTLRKSLAGKVTL